MVALAGTSMALYSLFIQRGITKDAKTGNPYSIKHIISEFWETSSNHLFNMSELLNKFRSIADEVSSEVFDEIGDDTILKKEDVEKIILLAVAKGYEAGLNEKATS